MASFKFVISDKQKSYQVEKDQNEAGIIVGKKIGEKFDASFLGLSGYELQITGGSDKDGFPMRSDIEGIGRRKIVVTKGLGFHAHHDGVRKRKSLVGNVVSDRIVQINCKITKQGQRKIEEIFAKEEVE